MHSLGAAALPHTQVWRNFVRPATVTFLSSLKCVASESKTSHSKSLFESQNGVSRVIHRAQKPRLRRAPIKIILIEELCKCFQLYFLKRDSKGASCHPRPIFHTMPACLPQTQWLSRINHMHRNISTLVRRAKKCSSCYGKQTKNIKMSSDLHLFHFQLISLFDTRVLYFFTERKKVPSDDIFFNSSLFLFFFFIFVFSGEAESSNSIFFFLSFKIKNTLKSHYDVLFVL